MLNAAPGAEPSLPSSGATIHAEGQAPPTQQSPAAGMISAMTTESLAERAPAQTTAYRLAAMLLGIGTLHFVAPKPFDEIIPAELPFSARFYTYASGVAELVIGALLLPRNTRRPAAAAAVALFIGVYPGNLNMVRLWWGKPWPMRVLALARLPLQFPMITAALRVYRNS